MYRVKTIKELKDKIKETGGIIGKIGFYQKAKNSEGDNIRLDNSKTTPTYLLIRILQEAELKNNIKEIYFNFIDL